MLGDVVGRGGRARGLDANRIGEELLGQPGDLRRHGGREEQGLLLHRRQLEDAFEIRDEAHVEHPVGLVDHHDLNPVEQQIATLKVIEQTPGGSDQHIDAAIEFHILIAE